MFDVNYKDLGIRIKCGKLWVTDFSHESSTVKFSEKEHQAKTFEETNEINYILNQFPLAIVYKVKEVVEDVTVNYNKFNR